MGLLGKMKNAITGGGANVSIEYPSTPVHPGDRIHVRVTVISTGGEIKTNGVYVDIRGHESGHVTGGNRCHRCGDYDSHVSVNVSHNTFDQAYPLSGAFTLQPNETKIFEGDITIPPNAQPTYHGSIQHVWELRGRIEAFGNDPDSGFQVIVVK